MKDSGCKDCGCGNKVIITKQGERGIQGEPGPPGQRGPAGVGTQGPAGADGADGADGTDGAQSILSFEVFADLQSYGPGTLQHPVVSNVTATGVFSSGVEVWWNIPLPLNYAAWTPLQYLGMYCLNFGIGTGYKIAEIKLIDLEASATGVALWGADVNNLIEKYLKESISKVNSESIVGVETDQFAFGWYDPTGQIDSQGTANQENQDWQAHVNSFTFHITLTAD